MRGYRETEQISSEPETSSSRWRTETGWQGVAPAIGAALAPATNNLRQYQYVTQPGARMDILPCIMDHVHVMDGCQATTLPILGLNLDIGHIVAG